MTEIYVSILGIALNKRHLEESQGMREERESLNDRIVMEDRPRYR